MTPAMSNTGTSTVESSERRVDWAGEVVGPPNRGVVDDMLSNYCK